MNVTFCRAKQGQTAAHVKKNPVICTLYEARAQAVQDYSATQQLSLKERLVKCKPTCAFAQILPGNTNEDTVTTPFGVVPKGSILSYQSLEYERLDGGNKRAALVVLPPLLLGMLDNIPCVYEINNDQQKL